MDASAEVVAEADAGALSDSNATGFQSRPRLHLNAPRPPSLPARLRCAVVRRRPAPHGAAAIGYRRSDGPGARTARCAHAPCCAATRHSRASPGPCCFTLRQQAGLLRAGACARAGARARGPRTGDQRARNGWLAHKWNK